MVDIRLTQFPGGQRWWCCDQCLLHPDSRGCRHCHCLRACHGMETPRNALFTVPPLDADIGCLLWGSSGWDGPNTPQIRIFQRNHGVMAVSIITTTVWNWGRTV